VLKIKKEIPEAGKKPVESKSNPRHQIFSFSYHFQAVG